MTDKESAKVSPERIMQFAFGFAPPLIIESGVRYGIFDTLVNESKNVEQIASETKTSPRGISILLNALVGLQLLAKDSSGKYSLTPESATFLVSTKPGYLGGFYKHTSTQLIPKWLPLYDIVRTGRPSAPVNQEGDGTTFFEQFVEDIFPVSYPVAQHLADHLGVPQTQKPISILDLAAGSGVWGIGIAKKSPHVRVTAVDWEGVIPVTKRMAEKFGVKDRFQFISGDLMESDFGKDHSIATLGHIIHSEGEKRSKELLKKTYKALASGGTIAISEWLVNDNRTEPLPALIFAVNMLVNTEQGDTFSFNEISQWLLEAGFINPRTLEGPGVSPLILATKK
jgi:ubiquinone/menaquinone biosynthesis C-methylase UbiE